MSQYVPSATGQAVPTIAVHPAPPSAASNYGGNGGSGKPPPPPAEPDPVLTDRDDPNQTLYELLATQGLQHYSGRDHTFYPYGLLRRIMTRQRIRRALWTECGIADAALVDRYCVEILPDGLTSSPSRWCEDAAGSRGGGPAGYLTVFALLIIIEKGHLIGIFIDQELSDARLPLRTVKDRTGRWILPDIRIPEPRPQGWFTNLEIDSFKSKQWFFFMPFFACDDNGTPRHYNLPADAELPWKQPTDDEKWSRGSSATAYGQGAFGSRAEEGLGETELAGGFGTVELVVMDPDSHGFHKQLDFLSLPKKWFAVKSLRTADLLAFKREINNLKRFSGRQHPHLVTLLATFSHKGFDSFIFPAADHDLDKYWSSRRPPDTLKSLRWVSSQVLGLTEAIDKIHAGPALLHGDKEPMFGRHGDLKPENILYFRPPERQQPSWGGFRPGEGVDGAQADDEPVGRLVITDFGLADVHRQLSKSMVPNGGLNFTRAWGPPECDMNGAINNLWDIWSLGCIYLELVCWMLGGQDMRKEFANARCQPGLFRNFVDQFHDVRLKPGQDPGGRLCSFSVRTSVVQWIELMHRHERCTQYLHDLLDLVYERMLVVRPPRATAEEDRIRSRPLLSRVRQIHATATAEGGRAYLMDPRPWRGHAVQKRPPVEGMLKDELQKVVDKIVGASALTWSSQSWADGSGGTAG